MEQPSKTNFKLQKIKLITGGGLATNYTLEAVIGSETYHSKHNDESTKQPHPDLEGCFSKMAIMVAQIIGFTVAKDLAYKPEFKADAKQKELLGNYVFQMTERIKVKGVSISGEGDKQGVVITSNFVADNKQIIAMNTPRIMLNASTRGFEEELQELIGQIETEAYNFLFNNKVANPEMFGPEDFEKKGKEPAKMNVAV